MAALDADPLARYWAKRDFSVTSEPRGSKGKTGRSLSFVIQKHAASRLHYDFRLELDGVLVSWAVPKGPSYDPSDKRMAIHVEDHPLSYASFEGTIPAKQYGAGTVIVWDNGTWEPVGDPHEGHIDQPDLMIFDLDPGEGTSWQHVQEAATLVRALLSELGLASWLKTSGGKGLHVVVPLAPRFDYETVKGFSQAVVQHRAKTIPSRFVARSGPSNRVGKLFVDYLRNGHGATTAAAFSARARPGLGVSMPLSWDDLPKLKSGAQWTIATAREYLSFQTVDPWADYWGARQALAGAMKTLGFVVPKRKPRP